MLSRDVIRNTLDMSDMVINAYLGDLTDADLKMSPMDGMNPIAWQLGHLIGAERHFVEMIVPGASPALPSDFEAGHSREVPRSPEHYYSLARYKELWEAQRKATRGVIEKQSDADLDRHDEKFPKFAATAGALLNMCGLHAMMHAGQFVAVRRKLGKPVVI